MATQSDTLVELSHALAAHAVLAREQVAAVRLSGVRHQTATIWRPDLLVASDQSLPKREKFEVVLPGGGTGEAQVAGRDPGTNLALLRLAQPVATAPAETAKAELGALAFAFGADSSGGATMRMGLVNAVGPEWHSRAGGKIDARIALDIRLSPFEEGGPVFDAEGRRLGITTLGPRRNVLVIPAETIEAHLPQMMAHGRVARGWLGVSFQPVAVPAALQAAAGQPSGLMVLSLAEGGPAAKAGVMPGDIVVAVDGTEATAVRKIVPRLGAESVGREVELQLLRGGARVTVRAVVEARPTS
jgi:S1-C subfamily serine protease